MFSWNITRCRAACTKQAPYHPKQFKMDPTWFQAHSSIISYVSTTFINGFSDVVFYFPIQKWEFLPGAKWSSPPPFRSPVKVPCIGFGLGWCHNHGSLSSKSWEMGGHIYIYNNIISISWLYTEALIPGIAPWNMFPQNMVGPNFPQPTGGRPRIPSTPRILGITRPGKR